MKDTMNVLQGIVASASAKAKDSRTRKIEKGTPSSWRAAWDDALSIFYPECQITYSDTVSAQLKRIVKARGLANDDVCAFLHWAVKNWATLRVSAFTNYPPKPFGPDVPEMQFLLRNIERAYSAFNRTKQEIALAIPTAARRAGVAAPPAPEPIKRVMPLPGKNPRTVTMPSVKLNAPSAARADEIRNRYGLRKWD